MKYQVNGFNNMCRVFELPSQYPKGYCFQGSIDTNFKMVDWFNPVPELASWSITEKDYRDKVNNGLLQVDSSHSKEIESDELQEMLTNFLINKNYIQNKTYLVICDFGMAFTFSKS